MKFYVSVAFRETKEAIEIARAADDLGYAGIGIPDHVVNLETLATPYPYTRDGERRWEPFTDWPDPWVLVGAIAQVTTRLKFVTTVYIPAMRDPYAAAKAIGTAAYISDGRVELGIGVGWCEEEFALMGQKFERRGKRTDEMLELFRALWEPGWTEFSGEFYQTPRLEMEPTPPRIPIYVGGLSEVALRRAALDSVAGCSICVLRGDANRRTGRPGHKRLRRVLVGSPPLVAHFRCCGLHEQTQAGPSSSG